MRTLYFRAMILVDEGCCAVAPFIDQAVRTVGSIRGPPLSGERGAVNLAGTLLVAISLVFVAVGFAIFPVVIEGADEARTTASIGNYTGLQAIVEIGPTLVFVGFLAAAVLTGFFGIRAIKG